MAGNNADLELPVQNPPLNRREGADMQAECHVRRGLAEQRNRLPDPGRRVAGRFIEHRHLQLAAHALVDFIHTRPEGVGGGKQLGGLRVNLRPFRRQRKAGAAPAAQTQTQAGFQVFDVPADRGRADVELQLGGGHTAAIDHGAEHPQQAQVHIADLAQGRVARIGLRCRGSCLHKPASKE